ncbi:MAG: GxxExxY protein [Chlamydiales bacterium]|nr:GxxExxY protein [Chlamydiales bacterium]
MSILNKINTAEKTAESIEELNRLTGIIIGAAIEVHRILGPGLLESTYEACLAFELKERGLKVERQVELPLRYKSVNLDCGYRLDLLVNDTVVVEIKAVTTVAPIHLAQLTSYLKLSQCRLGLLINFNVAKLRDGITRLANNF